jgi:phospholipid/cholesterol/gamma-HCH transport system ATP-binding protein
MITLDNVRKAFGSRPVLDGVSLALLPGRITALVGPNGSGKTTMIKCILGLTRPDAGRLLLDGEAADAEGMYRARIGYAPQAPHFPANLAVGEVFAMLRALRPGATVDESLLEAFSLRAEWATPVGTLSGGWRQKVSLAAAWLFSPDVIILDEPTAGLDPIGAGAFDELIKDLSESLDLTVFMITHDLDTLYAICDRVAVIADKKVVAVAPIEELERSSHPWIQEYFLGPRGRAAERAGKPRGKGKA